MAEPQNKPVARFSGAQAPDAFPRADHAPQPLYKANAGPCDTAGGGADATALPAAVNRPELHQLDGRAIAPLEARIAAFPEVWQELARSCFCTLLGHAGWPWNAAPTLPAARGSLPPGGAMPALGRPGGGHEREAALLDELSARAAALAMGIGADFGGSQPYIPIGMNFVVSEKYTRIVRAWRAGQPWDKIARAEHITARRVRHIVSAWQSEMFAQRQGCLALSVER